MALTWWSRVRAPEKRAPWSHRVAWLIEQGVPAEEIVLLTFTRRAAAEMLERVARMVGGRAHKVRGGTFHGFSNRSLRRYAEVIGYPRSFTILDVAMRSRW